MRVTTKNILFLTLLTFTVNSFVYFGFVNSYSTTLFNHPNFIAQFHSGVYQYRILSAPLVVWIYDALCSMNLDFDVLKLKSVHPDFDPKMYFSFYLLNTFFLVLTSAVLALITSSRSFVATSSEKILFCSVLVLTMALTQFVIVPYDASSYFFTALFIWIFLNYLDARKTAYLIVLGLILLISTLNRESSAVCISFAAAVVFRNYGFRRESLTPILMLTGIFILTYLGLRLAGNSFTTNDGNLFMQNFTQPKNLLGLLFWMVFIALSLMIAKSSENRTLIVWFHILALPYIFMCFYTGILYEARLYMPLFLISMTLSQIKLKSLHL